MVPITTTLTTTLTPTPTPTLTLTPHPDPHPAPVAALAPLGLIRLLQLASPALPIGTFAYSQGLEAVVELELIVDEASARTFLVGVLSDGLVQLELPILARLHRSLTDGDAARAERWSELLLASRETRERRQEEQHLGRALARLLADQGVSGAQAWHGHAGVTHALLFALGGVAFGVPRDALLLGYAFAWAESQVGALSRLVPLGQLAAQRVLASLAELIPGACERADELPDSELGATLPVLALASALHETKYCRLFKS
jgi:urease accessory protein